ncbi:MAG: ABC transporter permease [Ilumatobacter sp.]|nr:ABC transporter permease [Ilumatobacter sp.]
MIRLGLVDLAWRRRRFVVVVIVAALAFGLALTMTGVTNQLRQEGRNTVALFGADEWIVPSGVSGPFTSTQVLDRSAALAAARAAGSDDATAILIGRISIDGRDVNIVGHDPASTMSPAELRAARNDGPDGAIADVSLGRRIGDRVEIGGHAVPITGEVADTSFYFSSPTIFLPLEEVQRLLFAGQDVASTVVVQGELDPGAVGADGFDVLGDDDVLADFERVIKSSTDTITTVNVLLWLMAAGVVAGIVFLTVLERTRDFATLKALGSTDRAIVGSLVVQSSIVATVSAALAVGVSRLIAPSFSFPVNVPPAAYVQLLVVALVVGVVASVLAVRRIIRIDPVLAFGGTS